MGVLMEVVTDDTCDDLPESISIFNLHGGCEHTQAQATSQIRRTMEMRREKTGMVDGLQLVLGQLS